MHRPSKNHTLRLIRARSEKARRMAKARWAADRKRRDASADKDPAFVGLRILRRIVVIDLEKTVREAVIYASDSARSARRKIRAVMSAVG